MKRVRWLGSLVLVLCTASLSAQPRDITIEGMKSEKRLALVIGNGAYANSPLKNPVNDARAMAQTLRALGFDVMAYENVGEKAMRRAILSFGDRLQGGGVAGGSATHTWRAGAVGSLLGRRRLHLLDRPR